MTALGWPHLVIQNYRKMLFGIHSSCRGALEQHPHCSGSLGLLLAPVHKAHDGLHALIRHPAGLDELQFSLVGSAQLLNAVPPHQLLAQGERLRKQRSPSLDTLSNLLLESGRLKHLGDEAPLLALGSCGNKRYTREASGALWAVQGDTVGGAGGQAD